LDRSQNPHKSTLFLREVSVLELHTFYEWQKIKAKADILQSFLDMAMSEPVRKSPDLPWRNSLPVQYQGRRHGNGLVGFKKPATIQERRFNETLRTDDDLIDKAGRRLIVRAKRLNLPNGYEDQRRTVQRSWKEYRSTQYK
jgi:hypothetical protein